MGTRIPAARTPTGQLYNIPVRCARRDARRRRTPGWKYRGLRRARAACDVSGDEQRAGFLQYKDLKSGAYVNNFAAWGEKAAEARYVEAIGRRGRHGRPVLPPAVRPLQRLARHGLLRRDAAGLHDARTARSGTGSAATPSRWTDLTPGGTTSAAATQAEHPERARHHARLDARGRSARRRACASTCGSPNRGRLFASFDRREARRARSPSARCSAAAAAAATSRSRSRIDYYDLRLRRRRAVQRARSQLQRARVGVVLPQRHRHDDVPEPALRHVERHQRPEPQLVHAGPLRSRPRQRALQREGRVRARAARISTAATSRRRWPLGTMRQNDNLVAAQRVPPHRRHGDRGRRAARQPWNTAGRAQRGRSADARIDTRHRRPRPFDQARPTDLDVRGKVRYYETHNFMSYQSCNPLTGQWGRLLNDGSGSSLLTRQYARGREPGGNLAQRVQRGGLRPRAPCARSTSCPAWATSRSRASPTTTGSSIASVTADYRVGRASSVNARARARELASRLPRARRDLGGQAEARLREPRRDRGDDPRLVRIRRAAAGSAYDTNPYEPLLQRELRAHVPPPTRSPCRAGSIRSRSSAASTSPTATRTS